MEVTRGLGQLTTRREAPEDTGEELSGTVYRSHRPPTGVSPALRRWDLGPHQVTEGGRRYR